MHGGLNKTVDVERALLSLNAALRLVVHSALIVQPSSVLLLC